MKFRMPQKPCRELQVTFLSGREQYGLRYCQRTSCTGKNCALLSGVIESQDMGTNHLKLSKYDTEMKYGPISLLRLVITLLSMVMRPRK